MGLRASGAIDAGAGIGIRDSRSEHRACHLMAIARCSLVRTADGKDEFVVRDLATGADTRLPMPRASTGVATGAAVTWTPTGRLLYAAGGVETVADLRLAGRRIGQRPSARRRLRRTHAARRQGPDLHPGRAIAHASVPRADSAGWRGRHARSRCFRARMNRRVRCFDLSPDEQLLAYTVTDPTTDQRERLRRDISRSARTSSGDVDRRREAAILA